MIGLIGAGNAFTEIPILAFERLVKEGSIDRVKAADDEVQGSKLPARLAAASEEDLKTANQRFAALQLLARWLGTERSWADITPLGGTIQEGKASLR